MVLCGERIQTAKDTVINTAYDMVRQLTWKFHWNSNVGHFTVSSSVILLIMHNAMQGICINLKINNEWLYWVFTCFALDFSFGFSLAARLGSGFVSSLCRCLAESVE